MTKGARHGVYLAIAVGGAAGAISRLGIDRAIERRSFAVFPWATFTINISGCLLIGLVVAAIVDRHHTPVWLRTGLVVGFIGGYTTFSARWIGRRVRRDGRRSRAAGSRT